MQFLAFLTCVAVVTAIAASLGLYSYVTRFNRKAQRFIDDVHDRITNAQVQMVIINAHNRALMILSARLWREAGVKMPDGKSFEEALDALAAEQREHILAHYAKSDPKAAGKWREILEKSYRDEIHS